MKELQDAGIEFALDDFGTGYASFRYMQYLPITKVKIDKLFIRLFNDAAKNDSNLLKE